MFAMICLLQIIFNLMLLTVSGHHAGPSGKDVTVEELENLNANCAYILCTVKRDNYASPDCDCGASCVQPGTCCVDSLNRYIPKDKIRPVCRQASPSQEISGYYMVDQCPLKPDGSKTDYEKLCREEWNGQNDVMRIVPVTSLFTHITYKNFFCYRCHESGDGHMFWNVKVNFDGETDVSSVNENFQLYYEKIYGSWYSPVGQRGSWVPVILHLEPPESILRATKICLLDLISDCDENYQNDDYRVKCEAYMHVIYIKRNNITLTYRNPHCAFCNYESLEDMFCPTEAEQGLSATRPKKPFSFAFLIDVNPSSGEKVGEIDRCRGNDVWDPYFESCRTLICGLPGYTIQNGKCVPP